MYAELGKAIEELSLRMRMIKASQEEKDHTDELSERDIMILGLLKDQGTMSVSDIATADPTASSSTISTTITKLWRDKKLVSKTISPQSQRVTLIELTDKGQKALVTVMNQRMERLGALLKAIQVTDSERETLIDVCTRAVKFMDKHFKLHTADGSKKNN